MPRMYDMDDYGACRQQGKTFCETAAFFATTQNDSEIWKYIVVRILNLFARNEFILLVH